MSHASCKDMSMSSLALLMHEYDDPESSDKEQEEDEEESSHETATFQLQGYSSSAIGDTTKSFKHRLSLEGALGEPPLSAAQQCRSYHVLPSTTRPHAFLPQFNRMSSSESCLATSIDSLKQEYDRDTWRMFNRISLSRAMSTNKGEVAECSYSAYSSDNITLQAALGQKILTEAAADKVFSFHFEPEMHASMDDSAGDSIFELELDS